MEHISTVRQMIDLWGARQEFAAAIGVPVARVHKWASANAVPAKEHQLILEDAQRRGLPVTAELIVRIHARTDSAA